jgi:signal transduction histidine kinase
LSILLSNLNLDSISKKYLIKIFRILDSKNFNDKFTDFMKEYSLNSQFDFTQRKHHLFLPNFIKCIKDTPGINNFVLIGDKKIEIDDAENHYEIYCRFNHSQATGDELDFLLNDVTRTKLNEKYNAEFKYKTVFLSKVAHEFKNPLICITELIHQLSENLKLNNEAIKTISQIKSMSNFLLVLVKDLNYFSESQIGKNIEFENKEVNLDEIMDFCREITDSLILKSNKSNSVKFTITKSETPLKFLVDGWRLKQVLLNLLSNAIKFTNYGEVTLDVSLEKNYDLHGSQMLKFCVKDTGVGIKEENFDNLIGPFFKEKNKNNELGSGLGLSIASEISENLGGKLQFTSTYEKGSSFWFSIPYLLPSYTSNFNVNISKPVEENKSINSNNLHMDIISEKNANEQLNSSMNSYETKIKEFLPINSIIYSLNEGSKSKNICLNCHSSQSNYNFFYNF